MADFGIIVDTGGGMDIHAFLRNSGMVHSAMESMKGSMRAVNDAIAGAARGFARMGESVKGVLSALMHSANVAQGLEGGLRNLYRYGRGWWRSFADTLDALAGNALYLRNSLAAMAAPLISAIAPAIDFVTERFVGLFNLINQVLARLSGASTYVAAKKTGEAWDAVSGRISRATSALKRYIMGFDQLNILGDGTSGGDSGGTGGTGAGGGAGVMFEEREIESGLAGFADSLKAAFLASDWQSLGTLIGEKLNALVDSVDWAAAGSRVGYYVNALFSTAYWTLETVNFTNIGESVAAFLNSALAEIDFTAVGATIALIFTSLAETLAGFVDGFDWAQFAGKLADGVNGFVSKLGEKLGAVDWGGLALKLTAGLNVFIDRTDWANVGAVLAGRVNDLLAVLGTAAAGFDWAGAGTAMASAVNHLFGMIDWEALGTWLNDSVQGLLDLGAAFLEGFDAAGFAENVGKALAKVDWEAVANKLWTLFKAALKKLGELVGTLLLGGSADVKLKLSLLKDGWTSVGKFVGTAVKVLVGLKKNGWTSIGKYIGTAVTVLTSLKKNGWTSIAKFVGTAVTVLTSLKKKWSGTPQKALGLDDMEAKVKVGLEIDKNKAKVEIKTATDQVGLTGPYRSASGGLITPFGPKSFGSNNFLRGGLSRFLSHIPHFAAGGRTNHGTMFVAGEAGPEVVGHIGGRTEVLNKSQLAAAIYAAVVAGMSQAVNALGTFLSGQMAACTNAITGTIGKLAALGELRFHAPIMASGTVLPYEVAAQIARSSADIQNTLDANNEDLIQTIISVIGAQTTAIVAALQSNQQNAVGGGLNVQQVIRQINQSAQMFGSSPLLD